MGASKTEGLHPCVPRDAPEAEVQATTGNATATSPFSGAVVGVTVDPDEPDGAGAVGLAASSDVPHPVTNTQIRPRGQSAAILGFMSPPRADVKPPGRRIRCFGAEPTRSSSQQPMPPMIRFGGIDHEVLAASTCPTLPSRNEEGGRGIPLPPSA